MVQNIKTPSSNKAAGSLPLGSKSNIKANALRPRVSPQGSQKNWSVMQSLANNENLQALNSLYTDVGAVLDDEELNSLRINTPSDIPFPGLMFLIALTKDAIDVLFIIGTLGFWSALLGWIIWIVSSVILIFWLLGKVGIMRKLLFKKLRNRAVLMMFIDGTPIGILPLSAIFVLLAWKRESEVLNKILNVLEALESGRIKIPKGSILKEIKFSG